MSVYRSIREVEQQLPELFFRIRNLKKAFGKHLVLSGVNLDVYKGEILGIIGTSGSGKTTLLHAMIGFLKPDVGEVRILFEPSHRALGEPMYKDVHKNLSSAKQVYGFASQMPSFYDNLTVGENLQYYASLYDMPKSTIRTNMHILLHLMDLHLAKKSLGKNLSGGMERRLDIACALMHDPAILILDEPTADLDPVLRNHIYDLIRKINNKETTIILASHHLADLERVCDRIAVLKDGKIFALGTIDEIKDQFSDYHQVRVLLENKMYHEVEEEMKREARKFFIKSQSFNNSLLFYTNNPQECAKHVMRVAAGIKEKVADLHIGKPSLDDIFITIMEEEHLKKESLSVKNIKEMTPRRPSDFKGEERQRRRERSRVEREERKREEREEKLALKRRKEEERKRKAAHREGHEGKARSSGPVAKKEGAHRSGKHHEEHHKERKDDEAVDRRPIEEWLRETER